MMMLELSSASTPSSAQPGLPLFTPFPLFSIRRTLARSFAFSHFHLKFIPPVSSPAELGPSDIVSLIVWVASSLDMRKADMSAHQ